MESIHCPHVDDVLEKDPGRSPGRGVPQPVEGEDNVVSVEAGPVVEGDTGAQREGPDRPVPRVQEVAREGIGPPFASISTSRS